MTDVNSNGSHILDMLSEFCKILHYWSSSCHKKLVMLKSRVNISAATLNFQQCGILTSVDSDEHVQPAFSLEAQNDVRSVD